MEVDRAFKKVTKQNHILIGRFGENDRIADEAHGHKSCKNQGDKNQTAEVTFQAEIQVERAFDRAWSQLVGVLDFGFGQGHIFPVHMDAMNMTKLFLHATMTIKM